MRRVHAHPQRGRGCVVETVAFSRCFPGTRRCVRENYTLTVSTGDTQHAGHVFVCIHGAACVHSGNCARGTTVVDESSNPCQHRSCRCPRWVQWKFNFPPSFCAPKFVFSQKSPYVFASFLRERLKLHGLRWFSMIIFSFFISSWFGLEGLGYEE